MGHPLSPAGQQKHRMSKADIRWILAQEPLTPPSRYAALKRSNPELIPRPGEEADEDRMRLYRVVRAFYDAEESYPRLQEWVRAELRDKGYVELDDEAVKRRDEKQAIIDREWPAIQAMMRSLILSEKEDRAAGQCGGTDDDGEDYSDDSEDDSEGEDEEEDEVN
ncbi:hypothetical protein BS78_05G203100 [Paspalum vaginatum]|nr:hypothetical protein BS78_05G203100 [Paspalum vaginatum]